MAEAAVIRKCLLFLAAIAGFAALRAASSVTLPVTFALLTVAVVWPAKVAFDRFLPRWLGTLAATLLVVAGIALFLGSIYLSLTEVAHALSSNWDRLTSAYERLAGWARDHGLPLRSGSEGRVLALVEKLATDIYAASFFVAFVGILTAFAISEIHSLAPRLAALGGGTKQETIRQAAGAIAHKVRAYLGTTFLLSLVTGVACWLWSEVVGLELALTWGLLNFLLNFIPILGNVVGILPPTLYAFAQTGSLSFALLVFGGLAIIQFVISNVLNPALQGRSLALSPFAILVALAFWGWMWGIAGALIAIPLTSALVIVCSELDSARWIAVLLSGRAVEN